MIVSAFINNYIHNYMKERTNSLIVKYCITDIYEIMNKFNTIL